MKVITWLGSAAVIIPLAVIVGVFFVIRRHQRRPLALLAAAVAGAIGLYNIVKPLVGRPRPPRTMWIGHLTGAAFPSGHATQTIAFYATLAVILGAGQSVRAKAVLG
jgi:membrane-associated phospholipid phosphatase